MSAAPWAGAALVVAALVVAAGGGWPLTAWVLRRAEARDPDPAAQREADRLLRGGTWIGGLERLAITGSVLLGYPEAIAVVTAVKGLGRFPELRSATGAAASERFIIGTLTSFCWAGAVGAGARYALSALG